MKLNGLFVGVTVPGVAPNSGGGFGGVSTGVVEAGPMNGKPVLLSGAGVAAGAFVLGAAKLNGVEAGLGSTGVGTGVAVTPNGKALLGGSVVAVVGIGRPNLNSAPVLAVAPGDGAGVSAFVVAARAAGDAARAKPAALEAPVDPIAGKSNSFSGADLDLSPPSDGGAAANDGILIVGVSLGGVTVEARAESFPGDPLCISSSRVGGVLVPSRATPADVGCGLGAAVGAVNTIIGAGAEREIGAGLALNSGAGLA